MQQDAMTQFKQSLRGRLIDRASASAYQRRRGGSRSISLRTMPKSFNIRAGAQDSRATFALAD